MGSLLFCLLCAVLTARCNTIVFVKTGSMVLRPTFGKIRLTASLEPVFRTHRLLEDRMETLATYKNTTEDQKHRRYLIAAQRDRMHTVWNLFQDSLGVPLPVERMSHFNASLQDILSQNAADFLPDDEEDVAQRVIDQTVLTSNGSATTNPDLESVQRSLDAIRNNNSESLSESEIIRRVLSDPILGPSSNRSRAFRTRRARPTGRNEPGRGLNQQVQADINATSLLLLKTCEYLEAALNSDEMQLQDMGVKNLHDRLMAMDVNFVEWAEEFIEALEDFCAALKSAMEGRVSPLLLGAQELTEGLSALREEARDHGWSIVYASMAELFHVMRPWISVVNQTLTLEIEVPFSRGGLATLYRHVPVPWITKYFYLMIRPKAAYLVWEPEHHFAIEFTEDLMQGCRAATGIWHCTKPMLMLRKATDSCLYNLFHQRAEDIERTCSIQVESPRDFIVPITANTFQIVSYEPLNMIIECAGKLDPLRKVAQHFLLNLTKECPRAFTEERIFLYQQNVNNGDAIIISEVSHTLSRWMEGLISDTKEWVISKLLRNLESLFKQPVPIEALKDKLSNFIWEKLKEVLVYVTCGSLPLTIISFIWMLVQAYRRNRRVSRQNITPRLDPEAIPFRATRLLKHEGH